MHNGGCAGEVGVHVAEAPGECERDTGIKSVVIEYADQVVVQGESADPGREQGDREAAPTWREPATRQPILRLERHWRIAARPRRRPCGGAAIARTRAASRAVCDDRRRPGRARAATAPPSPAETDRSPAGSPAPARPARADARSGSARRRPV